MSRLASARRVVIKVGSALVVDRNQGTPSKEWLSGFAADLAAFRARGQQVLVVSSGAVALGRRRLGLTQARPSLPHKQAAAAAGQSILMRAWEEALESCGMTCAQILLTRDDTEIRRRWLNGRATIETLISLGVVPIVNENDTVVTEEIRYGDNDRLAARVAQMINADLLVLLSDIDGLYTGDPRSNPKARHIPEVTDLTPEIFDMAGGANAGAGVGTGGMTTKLAAARIAQEAGCATMISLGTRPFPLTSITEGARATLIQPSQSPKAAYKSWIVGSLSPAGTLVVDPGAAAALRTGKSLLAAGVTAVEGSFDQGDAVSVRGPEGEELARGLVRYDALDAARILGLKTQAIEGVLGYSEGPLIHADDLALLRVGTGEPAT